MPTIIIGALLPSLMLVYFIYRLDRFLEPPSSMIAAFFVGMLSPLLTLLLTQTFNLGVEASTHPWLYALSAAALPEELGRLLLLLWVCRRWEAVGEPFDCLVYGATIWAGFASTENILYALNELKSGDNPVIILAVRASLCTMGHTAWGVIMGAYVALARYGARGSLQWLSRGLLITVTLHLLYDGLLMSISFGHALLKLSGALCVDAFSLILAAVILVRMRSIQGISETEGDDRLLQTELFKRHTPDSSAGLIEILAQVNVLGFIKMLFAMCCSSLGLALLLDGISSLRLSNLLWSAVALSFGLRAWRAVLQIAYEVHDETGARLRAEMSIVKAHKAKQNPLWPFRRPPRS